VQVVDAEQGLGHGSLDMLGWAEGYHRCAGLS
jgi:hypothetical protein